MNENEIKNDSNWNYVYGGTVIFLLIVWALFYFTISLPIIMESLSLIGGS